MRNTILSDPVYYGWEKDGGVYIPVMTDQLPAPIAVIEMSVCKCNQGCANQRCKCRKNKLVCTEMCQCSECENVVNDSENEWESDDDDNGEGDVEYKT